MRECKDRKCNNGRVKTHGQPKCCYGCNKVCRRKCYSAWLSEQPYRKEYKEVIIDGFTCKYLKEESNNET